VVLGDQVDYVRCCADWAPFNERVSVSDVEMCLANCCWPNAEQCHLKGGGVGFGGQGHSRGVD
jgi:hypothetical protein